MARKIATKKVSKSEWARLIEAGIRKYELQSAVARKKRLRKLRRYLSVPLLIGLVAIGVYLWLFDWEWMMKGILNAIISATLVATFLTVFAERVR